MAVVDVAIVGGGVAGQLLARQLGREHPELDVVILDAGPLPRPSDHRGVGESTSELAAHYLNVVLDLSAHLRAEHVHKFGLRFFVERASHGDIARHLEIGPMHPVANAHGGLPYPLDPPAFQIHRGKLEHHLCIENKRAGVRMLAGARVRGVTALAAGRSASHTISFEHEGQSNTLDCRWVVDASGGASILPHPEAEAVALEHRRIAAWWWLDRKIDPADWSDSPEYAARAPIERRWLSTQHLCHRGHWIWIIPLSDGSTSVGIVADPDLVDLAGDDDEAALMALFQASAGPLAQTLAPDSGRPEHCRRLQAFARKAWFGRGWAVTGAAASFVDPLYSPAFDGMAVVNQCICACLSADKGANAEALSAAIDGSNLMLDTISTHLVDLYGGAYSMLGDPVVFSAKFAWDQSAYFAWLCTLYFAGKLTDFAFIDSQRALAGRVRILNHRVQAMLRAWHQQRLDQGREAKGHVGKSVDQGRVRWVVHRHSVLRSPHPVQASLSEGADCLERLALALFDAACFDLGIEAPKGALDPYGVGLDPSRWAIDRLVGSRRARAQDPGIAAELAYVIGRSEHPA